MLKIITLITVLLLPCKSEEYLARVTYYWAGNGGQVGNKTSTGKKPICGKTVSVDPKIIPYGSKVTIPQMGTTVIANDTGGAVKSRTASKKLGKNNIVVDVFCSSAKVARARIAKYPMFMKIIVEKS